MRGNARSLGIVVGMLVGAAAAMATALLAQRFVTGSYGVEITNAQLHVIEVLVLLAH